MDFSKNNPVRCRICRLHINLCVCAAMPHFDLATRVVVIMQHKEFSITSNTGHLIPKIFKNADLRFRGSSSRVPLNVTGLDSEDFHNVVLFPKPNAKILNADFVNELKAQHKNLRLIVPDGNWRQAQKIIKRTPLLTQLPKVVLPITRVSNYRLRRSPRDDGVCTFEAIARALGILEGKDVQERLEYFFDVMVDRVLWTRNKIEMDDVTGW